MWQWIELVLGGAVIAVTLLPLVRLKVWWVRMWSFPRLQIGVLGALALAAFLHGPKQLAPWPAVVYGMTLALCVAFHAAMVWRYSRFAPREVQASTLEDSGQRLTIAISNVLQTNRRADLVLRELKAAGADVVLCVEVDDWWRSRLDALLETHPHTLQCPLSNMYGMVLYSRLPLLRPRLEFLVQPDIPSMQAVVVLRNDGRVWINCVHPRPPAPQESHTSLPRDAELLLVARRVRGARLPVVVCGDLNDVAWSRTTRRFQKISRLLDPRKGRGMFSTFHAGLPGLRFPLDHIFHSDCFRLVSLRRLPNVGSDHFPVLATLSLEPSAEREQEAPEADEEDMREARDTIAAAGQAERQAAPPQPPGGTSRV
ncbi:endonuclease/exonuclease/phosphatase family protein [Ramlibacter sp. AN1015]|uniref:endonuclease/exonuclease/phosphatase family protein n=1 Tax=Ramlibacter sp. AN1015 TaxID=3133428 RepID=UPI0030BFDE59